MGNFLPTVTIILAELTLVLLVALVIALYFNMRKGRNSRAELETLLAPESREAVATPFSGPAPPPDPENDVAGFARQDTQDEPTLPPENASPPAVDPAFAARTEHGIAELREQLEHTKGTIGQLQHDNKMVSKELERMMENERSDVVHVQKDLVQLRKRVEELESTVDQINAHYTDLSKTLRRVRTEMDTLSNEYAAAYSNTTQSAHKREQAPQAAVTGVRETVDTGPDETPPAAVSAGAEDDEFALPDAALEAFNDALADDGVPPDTNGTSAREPYTASQPAALEPTPEPTPPTETPPAAAAETREASSPAGEEAQPAAAAGEEDHTRTTPDDGGAAEASTVERLFVSPATFEAGEGREGINVQEISLDELNIDDPHGLTTADSDQPARFEVERIFYQTSTDGPEGTAQGWYFSVRGGDVHGPFKDKESAERVLNEMIRQYQDSGDSGGR